MATAQDAGRPAGLNPILQNAQDFFQFTAAAERLQRSEEAEDLRFDLGGRHQWPDAILTQRAGVPGKVAARPYITINKLRQPVRQVVNQARLSRFGINVGAVGNAKKETALIRQGMIRHIEQTSNAQQARIWAFTRAVKCGRGFYRVTNKYANDGDRQLDISIDRILNQSAVYLDPTAKMADWSDMEKAIIHEDLTEEQYRRTYPKTELASLSEFESIGDAQSGWIWADGAGTTLRVAEFFWVETTKRTKVWLQDGSDAWADESPKRDWVMDERELPFRKVKWAKINGSEVIKGPMDWPGRYIPIIPVLGDELNIDGERIFEGIIRQAKDPQRSYNYMRSAQIETVALAPKAPWVVDPRQIKGFEHIWDQANIVNYAWLPRYLSSAEGQAFGEVYREALEPAIQAITLAAHEADADVHSATGFEEPALGKLSKRERSGKAIENLVAQGERGSFNFIDNLAIAITHEARIVNDLLGKTYKEKGRVQRILGKDDKERSVLLNIPFVKGQDGQPQAAVMGPNGPVPPAGAPPDAELELYDLSQGEFSVTVTIGKSTATENEEAASATEAIMDAAPQLTPIIADLYVKRLQFTGAEEMSDRLKKALPPNLQDDEEGAAKIPPQVQAQIQQADQMLQLLSKELDAKNDLIEKEEAKYEHEERMLTLKLASQERLAGLKLDIDILKLEQATGSAMAKIEAGQDMEGAKADLAIVQQRLSQLHDMSLAKEQAAQAEAADVRAASQAAQADARQGVMAEAADQRAVAGDTERMRTQAAVAPVRT